MFATIRSLVSRTHPKLSGVIRFDIDLILAIGDQPSPSHKYHRTKSREEITYNIRFYLPPASAVSRISIVKTYVTILYIMI